MTDDDDERAVISQPEDGSIDIPHSPNEEAALIQETRERVSVLKDHTADPGVVALMQRIDGDLEKVLGMLADTEEYDCSDRHYKLIEE